MGMLPVLESLFPIFALIGLGFAFKHGGWVPDGFWPVVEKLVYYLFFPALLVHRVAGSDLIGLDVWPIFAAVWATILLFAAGALLLRRHLPVDGPGFTSVFQGVVRFNTYVALAVPTALFGDPGTIIATMCVASGILLVNVICVMVLVAFGTRENAPSARAVALSLIRNPLVLAIVLGLLLNVSGLGLPPLVGPFLEILSRAALPMALLAIGAGLNIAAARAAGAVVGATTAVKLVLMPAVIWGIGSGLGMEGLTLAVTVLWGAMPGAPNAYILARALGGDDRMMAGIITITTLAAMLTLPVVILLLG